MTTSASTSPLYTLEQPASRAATLVSFAVLLPAACSVFLPLGLVAVHAADVASVAQAHPLATLQIVTGALLWGLLFLVPVIRRLTRNGCSRSVIIDRRHVTETITTVFGSRRTRIRPLSAFHGVVHRVRTSADGVCHQLALVADDGRDVLFRTAPRLDRTDLDAALAALALPEIKAADLLAPSLLRAFWLPAATPQTTAVAAA